MTSLTDDELLAWLDSFMLGTNPHAKQTATRFRKLIALQEWQPIETAPRDRTTIILSGLNNGYRWVGEGLWNDRTCAWHQQLGHFGLPKLQNPTHWRPLPPPPKDG